MKLFFLLITLFSFHAWAEINIPKMSRPIIDETSSLDPTIVKELESQIFKVYNNKQGPQLQVLVVSSLNGSPIEDVAEKVFRVWGLGDKKLDDGVLFLVAIKDRKMRIEVGYGLEGSLTDYDSRQITTRVKKYFKQEDYTAGVKEGVEGILEYLAKSEAVQKPTSDVPATKIKHVEKTKEMVQKENEATFLMFLSAFSLFTGMFVLRKTIMGYNSRVKEFKKSESDKLKLENDWDESQKRCKSNGLSVDPQEINQETKLLETEIEKLQWSLQCESDAKMSSSQDKYYNILNDVKNEQRKVAYLNSEINVLEKVIKGGK